MSIESIKRSVLFSLIVIIAMQAPCQAKSGADEVAAAGLIVAGMGVAVAGIASLVGWAAGPSDEQYLETAGAEYEDVLKKYNRYYSVDRYNRGCLYAVCGAPSECFGVMQESSLYEIALLFSTHGLRVSNHSRELSSWLSTLCNHRVELKKRIKKSAKTVDTFQPTIQKMRILCDEIELSEERMKALSNFYTHHSCYFELCDHDMGLRKRYEKELNDYMYNRWDGFDHDISRYHITRDYRKYPFIFYVESLENDLRLFKKVISKVSPYYGDRLQAAKSLYNTLYDIKNRVKNGKGYVADVCKKQHDELEEKRLALLKEQQDVRKKEMRILEKQAQLKREEVEQHERELRRQRAQAADEQTSHFSAHVHVHI